LTVDVPNVSITQLGNFCNVKCATPVSTVLGGFKLITLRSLVQSHM